MKKLSILVYHKDQQRLLDSLGEHGVVHIETQAPEEQEQVSALSSYLKRCDRALRALKQEKNKSTSQDGKTGDEILEQYETIEEGLSRTDQDINSLEKKIAQLRPWGSIDNETIKKLSEKGIKTSFFEVSTRKFNEIKLGDEAYISVVFQRNGKTGFVAFTREDINVPEAERIHLPEIPLEEAEKELEKNREIKDTLLKERFELGAYTDKLAQHIDTKRRELEYISAKEGMESAAEGSVLYMKGWFPAGKEAELKELLDLFNLWYGIESPAPTESVPVKMNNGRFSKLFEPVTKIFDLPDYFELDPTPFFAPLFAFFFGLCLGDLGYGFIISLVSVIALRKVNEKYKNLALMGLILGGMTMLCGVFTNTFFGHKIFAFAESGSGLLSKGGGAALLRTVNTESGTYYPVMPFSVYLGVMQLIIALIMKAVNQSKVRGRVYSIHPLANMLMIVSLAVVFIKINFLNLGDFSLGAVAIGPGLSLLPWGFVYVTGGAGLLLLFLFNNPDKGIGFRLGLGFWELYQFLTGFMADSLSYLRLFALGIATGLLGMAFNEIAFMFIKQGDTLNFTSPLIIFTILVLVFGHSLNLALNALGSFVHPLRLTFVEFYKNLDFKGGGKPYRPFESI